MSFKEACAKAAIKAGETGVQFFVYDAPTMWDVTASFRPGWLFRAYPGGRKVLSVKGAKLLQEDEPPNTCVQPDAGNTAVKLEFTEKEFRALCQCWASEAPRR